MRLSLECNADETVAMTLGVVRRSIVHSHSKGRVAKFLNKNSGVTGMVDEDFGSAEPTTFGRYVKVSDSYDVRLRIDKERNNRLVVICPRLEPWLINTAKASGLRMAEFNLSDHVHDLDSMINDRLPNVKRLLIALLEKQSPRLWYLKQLLLTADI